MNIGGSGSVMVNRYNDYDLDPTYRNAFGQPLMRMTFDYKENEHKMGLHAAQVINDIAKSMNPTRLNEATVRTRWTVVPYQSTHNTGGTIMGANPRDSALNKYLQSWDCHNLFVAAPTCFRTMHRTIRPGRWARSPIGRRARSRIATSRIPGHWCRHDALGRAKGANLTYATPGAGSIAHLAAELLARSAGFTMTHVTYRGVTPALTDVLRGEVTMMFSQFSTAKPLIASGELRALGIASKVRSAALPDVPTIAEAGDMPGFEAVSWYALMAPAGTPQSIVAKLHDGAVEAINAPEAKAGLEAQG